MTFLAEETASAEALSREREPVGLEHREEGELELGTEVWADGPVSLGRESLSPSLSPLSPPFVLCAVLIVIDLDSFPYCNLLGPTDLGLLPGSPSVHGSLSGSQ